MKKITTLFFIFIMFFSYSFSCKWYYNEGFTTKQKDVMKKISYFLDKKWNIFDYKVSSNKKSYKYKLISKNRKEIVEKINQTLSWDIFWWYYDFNWFKNDLFQYLKNIKILQLDWNYYPKMEEEIVYMQNKIKNKINNWIKWIINVQNSQNLKIIWTQWNKEIVNLNLKNINKIVSDFNKKNMFYNIFLWWAVKINNNDLQVNWSWNLEFSILKKDWDIFLLLKKLNILYNWDSETWLNQTISYLKQQIIWPKTRIKLENDENSEIWFDYTNTLSNIWKNFNWIKNIDSKESVIRILSKDWNTYYWVMSFANCLPKNNVWKCISDNYSRIKKTWWKWYIFIKKDWFTNYSIWLTNKFVLDKESFNNYFGEEIINKDIIVIKNWKLNKINIPYKSNNYSYENWKLTIQSNEEWFKLNITWPVSENLIDLKWTFNINDWFYWDISIKYNKNNNKSNIKIKSDLNIKQEYPKQYIILNIDYSSNNEKKNINSFDYKKPTNFITSDELSEWISWIYE